MARPPGGGSSTSSRTTPSWHREVVAVVVGRAAEQRGDRGRDVDEPAARGHEPVVAHALARDHERRAGLHDAERAVLAEVAALVLPVVRGGVDHAEVGRGRVVEELGDVVERERVRVVGAVRVRVGRSASRPANRSVDWSASGSRPVTAIRS